VDFSNLQRQIIHSEKNIGKLKLRKERLIELNSDISVHTYNTMLTSGNVMEIIKDYDVIIDGTDNFATLTWSMTRTPGKPMSMEHCIEGQVST
jgi:adenylyltransferase/sulfurtransferase